MIPRSRAGAQAWMEFEQMKLAGQRLNDMPQAEREFYWVETLVEKSLYVRHPDVSVADLKEAWDNIFRQARLNKNHKIGREELSVREHMGIIRTLQERGGFVQFEMMFDPRWVRRASAFSCQRLSWRVKNWSNQQQTYRLACLMGKRRGLYGFFQFAQEKADRLCAILCDGWISPAIVRPPQSGNDNVANRLIDCALAPVSGTTGLVAFHLYTARKTLADIHDVYSAMGSLIQKTHDPWRVGALPEPKVRITMPRRSGDSITWRTMLSWIPGKRLNTMTFGSSFRCGAIGFL